MSANFDALNAQVIQPPIKTRRLIMRPPSYDDIPAICRLINDPDIASNTGTIRYPYPARSAWDWISRTRQPAGRRRHIPLILTLRSNPRMIVGATGVSVGPTRPPEIGYWIARPYRRRGFASETTRALISLIFANSDTDAVGANARITNAGSQRVLKAAGMRRVGVGRMKSLQLGRYVPVILFRIDRRDWGQRHRQRA